MLVSEDEENVAFIAARGEKRYFYETKDGKLTLLQKVKNCLLKAAFSMILPIFANRLTIIWSMRSTAEMPRSQVLMETYLVTRTRTGTGFLKIAKNGPSAFSTRKIPVVIHFCFWVTARNWDRLRTLAMFFSGTTHHRGLRWFKRRRTDAIPSFIMGFPAQFTISFSALNHILNRTIAILMGCGTGNGIELIFNWIDGTPFSK